MPKKQVRKKPVPKKKPLEKQFDHFGEEVTVLGKKAEQHIDRKGEEWDSWFHRTLGPVGPILSSIFGIIVLVFAVWVLGLVNFPVGSSFVVAIQDFIMIYLGYFFLLFLLFSYTSYLSKASPVAYRAVSPFSTAIGVVFVLWIVIQALYITPVAMLAPVISVVEGFLPHLFIIILVIGYIVMMAKKPSKPAAKPVQKKTIPARPRTTKQGIHRLYRSGRDKILGGVCGGVGEYLGIDPVIVRLLWVIAIFVWGAGLLAYLIAWIIIPRNPNHKWE